MRSGVYSHRSGAPTGLQRLHDRKFSWASLADDCERAIAAASERLAIIKFRSVDTCAYWQVSDYFAVIGTHHNYLLRRAATDEETSLLEINRHSYWRTTRSNGPACDDLACLYIDNCHLILIHEIDVNFAGAIGRQKLRLSAQRDWVFNLSTRIDVRLECHERSAIA